MPSAAQSDRPGHEPMGLASVSLALLTSFLWGGTAVSNQFAMDVLPPMLVGGIRFALAAVFMLGWCCLERAPLLLKRGQWGIGWMMGLLLFLQIGTFNLGALWSSTSHASILVNSYIFWVAACEHLWQRTIRLRWWQLLGLALSGAGCAFVLLSTGQATEGRDLPSLTGDLVLVLSGLILAVKIVYTKYAVRSIAPGPLILWHDILGALMFFAVSPLLGETRRGAMTGETWVALLFAGLIVSGYCFGANAALLRKHGASQVSVFSFATPIFGVALGVWFRGDQLTPELFAGGFFVAIGILLTNFAPAPAQVQ